MKDPSIVCDYDDYYYYYHHYHYQLKQDWRCRAVASPSVCVSAVDGLQQSVNLTDGLRGSQVTVAKLTIAFTGTSFDMDKFPDRPTQNGVTNGNV